MIPIQIYTDEEARENFYKNNRYNNIFEMVRQARAEEAKDE